MTQTKVKVLMFTWSASNTVTVDEFKVLVSS